MGESSERSVEYPDRADTADSEVADRRDPDKPDRAEPELEKSSGPQPLQLSSSHDEPDSGLPLDGPLPFTVTHRETSFLEDAGTFNTKRYRQSVSHQPVTGHLLIIIK